VIDLAQILGNRPRGYALSKVHRGPYLDLRVEQVFDQELRRYLRMARVVNVGRVTDPDELPPLYGPLSVAMSPAAFSLAGFERVDGADVAQSWLVSTSSVLGR